MAGKIIPTFDKAGSAREYDTNGWFEVKGNPISKEGIFEYSGAQIGAPPEDRDKIFKVYRPASELSKPETLESFRLLPIIDDHEMLGGGYTAPEEYGVAGIIGENLEFKEGVMRANLKVFGSKLAEKIKDGKTELSCGYRCRYEFTPGTWNGQKYDVVQRDIFGNHLAVVEEGRMGPEVAIMDHMIFTVDAKETTMDEEIKAMLAAIMARLEKLEGEKVEVKAEAEDEFEEVKAEAEDEEEVEAKAEDEEVEVKAEDSDEEEVEAKAMDAKIRKLEKQVKALSARPAMDEAAVLSTLARKGEMVARLTPHIGVFDHAHLTADGVAAYGVKKLGIKNVAKGHELIALDAYLQAATVSKPHVAMDAKETGLGKALGGYVAGNK